MPMLVVTAAASAAAAYACSKLWAPGTLASAAFTPVLIALLKEAFSRPTYAVARAVPVRGVVRSARTPGDDAPVQGQEPVQPSAERVAQQGEIPGRSERRRHHWRLAVVTGLLGFVLAAVLVTVPEFIAGRSAAGGDRQTTIFGGSTSKPGAGDASPSTDAGTPTVTVAPQQTVTVAPQQTVTVAPQQTVTTPPTEPAPPAAPPPPAPSAEPPPVP